MNKIRCMVCIARALGMPATVGARAPLQHRTHLQVVAAGPNHARLEISQSSTWRDDPQPRHQGPVNGTAIVEIFGRRQRVEVNNGQARVRWGPRACARIDVTSTARVRRPNASRRPGRRSLPVPAWRASTDWCHPDLLPQPSVAITPSEIPPGGGRVFVTIDNVPLESDAEFRVQVGARTVALDGVSRRAISTTHSVILGTVELQESDAGERVVFTASTTRIESEPLRIESEPLRVRALAPYRIQRARQQGRLVVLEGSFPSRPTEVRVDGAAVTQFLWEPTRIVLAASDGPPRRRFEVTRRDGQTVQRSLRIRSRRSAAP